MMRNILLEPLTTMALYRVPKVIGREGMANAFWDASYRERYLC